MGTTLDQMIINELSTSLFANPKFIPAKYHYDARGSQLFEEITELEEYYPTRCEREILFRFKKEITDLVPNLNIIELGAGDGHKTTSLLEELILKHKHFEYIPIDVSEAAVNKLTETLKREYSHSSMFVKGITAEYFDGLAQVDSEHNHLILFLGSTIGNFEPAEAHEFLLRLRQFMKQGDVLFVGFDMKKDPDVLQRAYKDAKNITSEFNLNVLDRLNRELGANFNREKFQYYSFYNVSHRRVESWLISKVPQTIDLPALQKKLHLHAWEGIHMENSYKFDKQDIEELVDGAGYRIDKFFTDPQHYFSCAALKLRG